MKFLIFLPFICFQALALDPSRFINELNYLRESSSLVKEVEISSEDIAANSPEEVKKGPLDQGEIVNIEGKYFSDEVSTRKAAPMRSR